MRTVEKIKFVEIPEEVEVEVRERLVTVRGQRGELSRDFFHAPVSILLEGNLLKVGVKWPRKKEAAIVGTICSHIRNMITGVTEGFIYRLKIVFSHFPISAKVQGKTLVIGNFTGERSPRIAKIMGDAEVLVKDDDVIVQGINLEDVSQTAANIQRITKVKKKDPRVFLDGIYVYQRQRGIEA